MSEEKPYSGFTEANQETAAGLNQATCNSQGACAHRRIEYREMTGNWQCRNCRTEFRPVQSASTYDLAFGQSQLEQTERERCECHACTQARVSQGSWRHIQSALSQQAAWQNMYETQREFAAIRALAVHAERERCAKIAREYFGTDLSEELAHIGHQIACAIEAGK